MNIYNKMRMHSSLGIDIDFTLIDGPNSNIIQDFCKKYYKSKNLYLITFRTNVSVSNIPNDLKNNGINKSLFDGIYTVPTNIMNIYNNSSKYGNKKEIIKIKNFIHCWKAMKCFDLQCTALVDDLKYMVLEGCKKYNIDFIDSLM